MGIGFLRVKASPNLQTAETALGAARQVAVELAIDAALDQVGLVTAQELLVGTQAAFELFDRQATEELLVRLPPRRLSLHRCRLLGSRLARAWSRTRLLGGWRAGRGGVGSRVTAGRSHGLRQPIRLALALISDRVAVPVADASLVLGLECVDAFDRGQRQVRWYLEALEVLPRGDFVVDDDGRADP